MYNRLLIKAENFSDCDTISSLIQDSIVHTHKHSFHKKNDCLRLMLNRFCWETHKKDIAEHECYFRVHSGLYIHSVRSIHINKNISGFLNLLAMHVSQNEVNLLFSDNIHLRIIIDDIKIYMKDLHDRHPTLSIPKHEVA